MVICAILSIEVYEVIQSFFSLKYDGAIHFLN